MKVLVTGASGLLGSHIVKDALERGHQVVANYRKITKRNYLFSQTENPNITHAQFDLTDSSEFPKDMQVDAVINCAALASSFEKDSSEMNAINVEGVRNLYSWANANGVKQFVQVSSIAALGSSSFDDCIDEESTLGSRDTAYGRSKKEADSWLDSQGMKSLIIHPCYMLGEWDARPSSGVIFFALKMNKLTHYINHSKNFVSVKDVARGTLDAVEKQYTGHLILGGENHTIKNFLETFSKVTGKSIDHINELTDLDEKLDDEQLEFVKEFCLGHPVDISKAQSAINYDPKFSLEEMICESLDYFKNMKMLRFK